MLAQPLYVTPANLHGSTLATGQCLLGVVGFSTPRPARLHPDCPFAAVELKRLRPGPSLEAWVCQGPVTWRQADGIQYGLAPGTLFGMLDLNTPGETDLAAQAFTAYQRIFALADSTGRPHVLRVFNYLPDITGQQDGTERYRRFNAGRHAAFEASGRAVSAAPAACALGTPLGNPVIYFVAAAAPGRPVENPRQVSAYHYPAQYGPRSPSFSRAMLAGDPTQLFISGTASIVGHETVHLGDAAGQTDETIRNLQALLDACGGSGMPADAASLRLKVYIRHAADVKAICARLDALHRIDSMMLLQADICRQDLLVEIEGYSTLGAAGE